MPGLAGPLLRAGALVFWACWVAPAWAGDIKPWTGPGTMPLVLKSVGGAEQDLAALKGRVVVVNFWATWCEPCRDEMPSLERLRTKLRGKPFELLTVNYGESAATVNRFIEKLQLKLPVLLDPHKNAAEEWKVRGLPMTFIVDARGVVRFWTFGEREWSEGEALKVVEGLVAEARGGRR